MKDIEILAASMSYTNKSLIGGGAIKGKNCVISDIRAISNGHRVTFQWTLDDGTVETGTMDVMDGIDGATGQDGVGVQSILINSSNHLIIIYTDGTTQDAGELPGGGGGSATWGGITGTLSNQTDLQTALNEKVSEAQMIAYINENVIGGAD